MSFRSLRHVLSHVAAVAAVTVSGASPEAATSTTRDRRLDADVEVGVESDADPDAGAGWDLLTGEIAGQSLANTLSVLPPLEATHTACVLALSTDRDRRLAIACALEWAFQLVGDDLVIDHLSADPDARIRRAAARAAWARRAIGGDPGVLARLAHDPDPRVREVAALAEPQR